MQKNKYLMEKFEIFSQICFVFLIAFTVDELWPASMVSLCPLVYDEVWSLPYIPVHGDDKIIFGSMTTYNPPFFGLKKSCDS